MVQNVSNTLGHVYALFLQLAYFIHKNEIFNIFGELIIQEAMFAEAVGAVEYSQSNLILISTNKNIFDYWSDGLILLEMP